VRAISSEQAHLPVRVAERDQVLGEDADAYWRTVRLWQLARESNGQPEAAKQITHRCAWASAAEQLIFRLRNHRNLLGIVSYGGLVAVKLLAGMEQERR
jgi:hypothetical protein